ncbi:hypothetical protein JOB18_022252 [Solea senegalensis]|uniref:Membrane protein FAM174B n=1 Tax=Solea senegalensis TaxID=28829 RepID=A0AAV6SZD1_SOLSE|nr:membrane protein FAM174B [Solea senegalensis]KAG7522440.1 hypothetical protein JOB18_022252 [Solea senegalensis]KAG7522441.1 hypothetical protein JOB18_022252 [Solea senegalensis]
MLKCPLVVSLILAVVSRIIGEPQTLPSVALHLSSTPSSSIISDREGANVTDAAALGSHVSSSFMTHLPALKNIVLFICVLTAALVTCLLTRVLRSGKKIRKTRKYDIITTPAERVEMAPLNEEHDDEDDSVLFDVKYR